MANLNRLNAAQYRCGVIVAIGSFACLSLAGCAGADSAKSVTTTQTDGAGGVTSTTTVNTSNGGSGTNVNVDVSRQVEPNAPIDPNNTTVQMGSEAPAGVAGSDGDTVHVNMPGVHVNVDHASGGKDIDVPFVHIHKDGQGHTQVDTPFVHVDKQE